MQGKASEGNRRRRHTPPGSWSCSTAECRRECRLERRATSSAWAPSRHPSGGGGASASGSSEPMGPQARPLSLSPSVKRKDKTSVFLKTSNKKANYDSNKSSEPYLPGTLPLQEEFFTIIYFQKSGIKELKLVK